MARETRFNRRVMGHHVREFFKQAKVAKLRSRISNSPSGVIYVFVFFAGGEAINRQKHELTDRCLIARQRKGAGETVIGVGISKYNGKGSFATLVYLKCSNWSAVEEASAAEIQRKSGFFTSPTIRHEHEDEYPEA
jgi:hypothetical protein